MTTITIANYSITSHLRSVDQPDLGQPHDLSCSGLVLGLATANLGRRLGQETYEGAANKCSHYRKSVVRTVHISIAIFYYYLSCLKKTALSSTV